LLNTVKNIGQKEKIKLFLEQRKPIIEDWKHTYYLWKSTPLAMIGTVIIFIFLTIAIFAPLLTSYSPTAQFMEERLLPPGSQHIFGTDQYGRDVFSRVVYGARVEVWIIFIVSIISVMIGIIVGITAGYFGGVVDDMFLAFPRLVLAMVLTAALGPNLTNTMIAIALVDWTIYARLGRAEAMKVKSQPYIEAIRAIGANDLRIIFFHVLPMSISPVIVQLTLRMGTIILTAAGLGFLGLGAQPPTPEWGAIVSDGRSYLVDQWWITTFPGIAIAIVVLGFNLLGDGIRDILDPRLRR
jgi:peptide/nickel transport system permease protein